MLSYELCKQLKEAGFPQAWPGYYDYKFVSWYNTDGIWENSLESNLNDVVLDDVSCVIPTLSELIEACPLEQDNNLFTLSWYREGWQAGYDDYDVLRPNALGKTPEEAVANLWLKLQEC